MLIIVEVTAGRVVLCGASVDVSTGAVVKTGAPISTSVVVGYCVAMPVCCEKRQYLCNTTTFRVLSLTVVPWIVFVTLLD